MHIMVDGLKVNYISEGEGQTIILLHGWGANIQVYTSIIELLKGKYNVLALDMPGFGQTEEPPSAWDVDHYVDFVLDFLSNFRLDHVVLMGHSFGCRVIIKMLNRPKLPFAVDKVIIVDGAGIKPPQTLKKRVRVKVFKMGKALCNTPVAKKLAPDGLDKLQRIFGSEDYSSATPTMRQSLVKVVNEDLTGLIPNVKAETLLIWGDQDTATPLTDGQKMEKLMPNAGLAVINNAGHFSFLDQPYIFRSILSSYLHLG